MSHGSSPAAWTAVLVCLVGITIGGLALALAAQDTVANFFGAIVILVDRPFHIGDMIRIDPHEGTVETIGFRSIRVRTADGHLVTIPNKTVGNAIVSNISRRPHIRTVMVFKIAFDTPAEVSGDEIPYGVSGVAPAAKLGNFNVFPDEIRTPRVHSYSVGIQRSLGRDMAFEVRYVGNTGVGLACGTEKASFVAACAEVTVDRQQGIIKVKRVCQAYECGKITSPRNLLTQVEGSIIDGIGGRDQRVVGTHGHGRLDGHLVRELVVT